MDDYSKEELLKAIKSEIEKNTKLKKELAKAQREKNNHWLRNLSEEISMRDFGHIIIHVVAAVVREIIFGKIFS